MTISRDDIEAKAREVVGAIEETTGSVRDRAVVVGIAIAVVVAVAFIVGRRRGSRHKTLIEVYRV